MSEQTEKAKLFDPEVEQQRSVAEVLADDSLWGFIDPHGAKAARMREEADRG